MARRRLSDLLREEANKPSEDETAAADAAQVADEPDAEVLEAEVLEAEPNSDSTKASATAKSRSLKLTEPAETKAAAPQQDEALLQKITDLTSTLEAQKATVEQLQTELEKTRKDVRLLTDANAKLTQELKALQTKKTTADTSALKKADTPAPQELKLAPRPAEPSASVEASGHPLNTFNRDVGWFD